MTSPRIELPQHLLAGLKQRYGEAHRAYHNWSHVEALMRHYYAGNDKLNAPATVLWALYWHDAIYDPSSASNERDSAALLRDEAAEFLPQDKLDDAAVIIEATARHAVPSGLPAKKQSDLEFFLDIDLSILGQNESVFDKYETAIRKEYAFVPIDMYKAGRISILKGFLDRKRLYFTDHFYALWERKARENLNRSLVLLSAEL